MTDAKLSSDRHHVEAQLFEALAFEALEMEIISIKQLQKHFSLGFNQAARFMEYLMNSSMFEETTVLAVKPEYQDMEVVLQYLGLDPQKSTLADFKQAKRQRQNRVEALKQHLMQLWEAERLAKQAVKKS